MELREKQKNLFKFLICVNDMQEGDKNKTKMQSIRTIIINNKQFFFHLNNQSLTKQESIAYKKTCIATCQRREISKTEYLIM